MATEAQVRANRLNAQRSTGPRTAQGKAEAAHNAVKHGLLAREGVIRGESREEYEIHREMLMEELGPVGALAVILATRVVDLSWRLRRAGQDMNEAFGALYERYVAREGSAGAEAGSDGAMALGVEDIPASKRGQDARDTQEQDARATQGRDARDTQGPEALATGGQSLLRANRGDADDTSTAAERGATLGRMILEDFEQDAVLERLLRHERRIEGSLYRTLNELRRLRAESPSSRFTDPVPHSPREDETCETNPIRTRPAGPRLEDETCETNPMAERVSSWKCEVASESCETNPISPGAKESQVACGKEVRNDSGENGRTETKPICPSRPVACPQGPRGKRLAASLRTGAVRRTKPICGGRRGEGTEGRRTPRPGRAKQSQLEGVSSLRCEVSSGSDP